MQTYMINNSKGLERKKHGVLFLALIKIPVVTYIPAAVVYNILASIHSL